MKYSIKVFAKTHCPQTDFWEPLKKLAMKKLNVEQLEATVGGRTPRLRTCFIAGMLTTVAVGIGFGSGTLWAGGTALVASLSAANYNGCL